MPVTDSDSTLNTRARLIEAAIFCFSEKGYDATGIREIGLKAKANSALVQYHFGGKEGLFREAMKFIFSQHPPVVTAMPASPDQPGARAMAIQAFRTCIGSLVYELMACSAGSALDRAALLLITRELQAPHPEVIPLVMEHVRPYLTQMEACLAILRPDLTGPPVMDMTMSIYGQIFHLHNNLHLIRLLRADPEFPRDLEQLVDHFTAFNLRGIAIPEAFPAAGA